MRVYLDLCCLKRPFDFQGEALIRLQTEAVLSILALPSDLVELLRSQAQLLENSLNPVEARREAVGLWVLQTPAATLPAAELAARTGALIAKGFKSFDAFHLASAELCEAGAFVTVDLQLLKLAARMTDELRVRVTDPVQLLEEVSQWKQ